MVTQGYDSITTLEDFNQILTERFDKDPKIHFRELAQLKQENIVEHYVTKFWRLAVIVPNVTERRLMVLFVEGLLEPLKGSVREIDLSSLQEAIRRALNLEVSVTKDIFYSKKAPPFLQKNASSKEHASTQGITNQTKPN